MKTLRLTIFIGHTFKKSGVLFKKDSKKHSIQFCFQLVIINKQGKLKTDLA